MPVNWTIIPYYVLSIIQCHTLSIPGWSPTQDILLSSSLGLQNLRGQCLWESSAHSIFIHSFSLLLQDVLVAEAKGINLCCPTESSAKN